MSPIYGVQGAEPPLGVKGAKPPYILGYGGAAPRNFFLKLREILKKYNNLYIFYIEIRRKNFFVLICERNNKFLIF